MSRLEALKELAAKVEAGTTEGTRPFAKVFGLQNDNRHLSAWSAYHGSLDSALALHEAVLGDAWLLPAWLPYRTSGKNGVIVELHSADHGGPEYQIADADTPARAWLIAILRALIAEADQ